eukprot:5567994-Amphidinium_carterae.1
MLGAGDQCFRVVHQVYDRGISDQLAHYCSGVWEQSCAIEENDADDGACDDLNNCYILHTLVHCCCHDIHNSLRWAHQTVFGDAQLLRSVYVSVAALRVGSMYAAEHVLEWLQEVLVPISGESCRPCSELEMFWNMLCVDVDVVTVLLKYQLYYDNEKLYVHEEVLQEEGAFDEVSMALLSVWKFSAFSESRWVSLGTCCRTVTAAFALGFESVFSWMCERKVLSEYELHGAGKLDSKGREFMWVIGLSSGVADGMLLAALADNRIAAQADELQHSVVEEVIAMQSVPWTLWLMLSQHLPECTAQRLRDSCIRCVLISSAFLKYR